MTQTAAVGRTSSRPLRILLTGAFGNIGLETLRELLRAGHRVRCFDLPSPRARALAGEFRDAAEIAWGDLCSREDVDRAVADRDAVIHDAAVIPPLSERKPEVTRRVNVEGTRNIVSACQAQRSRPTLVFASSFSLFGCTQHLQPPRRAHEEIAPSDHYSHSKAVCEQMIVASDLDWIILRFGAAPPSSLRRKNALGLRQFFAIDPATRVEYVDSRDAALAQTRAVACDEALRKILLIGGGRSCQIRMRDLYDAALNALGVGSFPDSAYGGEPYYTDWLDTEESQRLLQYQRYGFALYRDSLMRRMQRLRRVVRPLRRPIRRFMLLHSPTARRA
jgi:nucleoside-diphosphate-sugar epimerase